MLDHTVFPEPHEHQFNCPHPIYKTSNIFPIEEIRETKYVSEFNFIWLGETVKLKLWLEDVSQTLQQHNQNTSFWKIPAGRWFRGRQIQEKRSHGRKVSLWTGNRRLGKAHLTGHASEKKLLLSCHNKTKRFVMKHQHTEDLKNILWADNPGSFHE